ncbi:hypothetical protein N657DRAFT_469344 [Parathielavia appendiculata]|uniref:Uncharacterized protein n=1 Tax=Parathielavia appendiculata TaxID=2587402 RepID=A0AAN6Z2I1_9PEZI|nr:hypothetical protein N657DRAFT_469344 [Parathielavia appendiculata]
MAGTGLDVLYKWPYLGELRDQGPTSTQSHGMLGAILSEFHAYAMPRCNVETLRLGRCRSCPRGRHYPSRAVVSSAKSLPAGRGCLTLSEDLEKHRCVAVVVGGIRRHTAAPRIISNDLQRGEGFRHGQTIAEVPESDCFPGNKDCTEYRGNIKKHHIQRGNRVSALSGRD